MQSRSDLNCLVTGTELNWTEYLIEQAQDLHGGLQNSMYTYFLLSLIYRKPVLSINYYNKRWNANITINLKHYAQV